MNEREIGNLFPTLSDEMRNVAAENLDRYLELAWEIFEEVQARERSDLTEAKSNPTIQERSIPQ
jgi:hypothetical protein